MISPLIVYNKFLMFKSKEILLKLFILLQLRNIRLNNVFSQLQNTIFLVHEHVMKINM